MNLKKQEEIIKQLSDRELLLNLYLTQALLLILSLIIGTFLFDNFDAFFQLLNWDQGFAIGLACSLGLFVVFIDILMMRFLPRHYFDDGGINERIFRNLSVVQILILTSIIAVSEEVLFRGVIQTNFGLVIASVIFALVHVRYLSNLFLFCNVLLLSFIIGIIYKVTGNLLVTVFMHFTIDFCLGLYYRFFHNKVEAS